MKTWNMEIEIGFNNGGTYVEFFDEELEKAGRFYVSPDEAALIVQNGIVPHVEMRPIRAEAQDPFDLACERRYD